MLPSFQGPCPWNKSDLEATDLHNWYAVGLLLDARCRNKMLGLNYALATNLCDLGQLASLLWALFLSEFTDEGLR